MKTDYETLVEAIQDLKARGYTKDFNLKENCIECRELNLQLQPEQFEVREIHRFEGMTNPADSSVVYAIESGDGLKGLLVDAYGAYASSMTLELAQKLRSDRN
jgi:hypothetical protein